MDAYCLDVRKLENKFYGLEFRHVVRENNIATDVLSKVGSTRAQVPVGVFVHELHAPCIPEPAPMTTDPAHLPAGGCILNPPSRRDSHPIFWSTTLKLLYLPTLCGNHRQ
jgi:hypothetical protein